MALPREARKPRKNSLLAKSLGTLSPIELQGASRAEPKPPDPEKETAAQAGPLNGGKFQKMVAPRNYAAAARVASVRLAPIWADGYLAGWVPLSYAAADMVSRMMEAAQ